MNDDCSIELASTMKSGPAFKDSVSVELALALATLRGDFPFYLFIAAYACTASFLGTSIGAQGKLIPLGGYLGMLMVALLTVGISGLLTAALALCAPSFLPAWKAIGCKALPGLLLFMALTLFIGVFSSVKQMLPDIVPFFADPMLADLDAMLHAGDPWRLTNAIVPLWAVPQLETLYLGVWGAVKTGAVLAVLFSPNLRHLRAQFIWSDLLIWTGLGNIIAAGFMSGGPVFYERITGDAARYSHLSHFLATHTQQKWVQDLVWLSSSGQGAIGSGVSAFPSLHVAGATLCALLAWHAGRYVRWMGIALVGVILIGSVHLGWHYAVDGYFSVAATVLIWKIVGWRLKVARDCGPKK